MATQAHRSDPGILGRRTLRQDHRRLAELLRHGMAVLDVGCGTGAITAGIARAVGAQGRVVGMDRDVALLDLARRDHGALSNLEFVRGDALAIPFAGEFDIVTAARTLQWVADPAQALARMKNAAKSSGMVVVLDYSHVRSAWEPEPPPAFRHFYDAFLRWRAAHDWDNEMADHLPDLFLQAGMVRVESVMQDEVTERGQPGFDEHAGMWAEVIGNVGEQLEAGGFCSARQLEKARESYQEWIRADLQRQTLAMKAVSGMAATGAER